MSSQLRSSSSPAGAFRGSWFIHSPLFDVVEDRNRHVVGAWAELGRALRVRWCGDAAQMRTASAITAGPLGLPLAGGGHLNQILLSRDNRVLVANRSRFCAIEDHPRP